MQGRGLQMNDWMQQLAALIFLAGCFYLSFSRSSSEELLAQNIPEQDPVTPEVKEFQQYPRELQKQALTYIKKWQKGVQS